MSSATDTAAEVAALRREINALRSLLSAIVAAWREPDGGIGRMARLVKEAENRLLTDRKSGVH